MRRVINVSLVLSSLFLLFACDDVLEDDITDDVVTTVSPKDETALEGNSVQFRWEELEGADEYRIQVIEEVNQRSVLDSLVSGSSFTFGLNPGTYNWRIRGENFAYVTAYSFPSSFTLTSSDDLSIQEVFLTSPSDNFYTNKDALIVSWDRVRAATSYTVVVDKTIQGNTATEIQTPDVTDTNFTLNATILSEDAIYTWKVKAVNDNSETNFSTRRILLDTQIPNQPTLSSPTSDANVSTTVTFTWNISGDTGEVQSPITSILEIATDEGFGSIVETVTTNNNSQQLDFADVGDYYWRVKAKDEAGNESTVSEGRKFTVQ
ncbi:hypothetical protein U6A24_11185 [Aquimarina gracilis]|uniref:Fibronectin type-III domain-containing protein n=1 Tax=Aquimarina gracilis TaxID=874422 RepID=A0ABU5ZVX0_9FLAO|nr:hypothetical protein [Aquimarina gracilis]MEB3346029.1 hypothetical protein [Aquimarina gracilis]